MSHAAMVQKIQIARRQLGLDEAEYRALLKRVGKVESSRDLTDRAAVAVIDELKRLGFVPKASTRQPSTRGDIRKIYALWKALFEKGRVNSRESDALRAWTQRQFKVGAPEFLKPAQARIAIEQLKAWLDRPPSPGEKPC